MNLLLILFLVFYIQAQDCPWVKMASRDLGGYDVYRGQTKGGMTAQQCQRRCDSISRCKAIMHGNSMNSNRWFRNLCWIKTYSPRTSRDSRLKYNRGVDVYVRLKADCRYNKPTTVVRAKPAPAPAPVKKVTNTCRFMGFRDRGVTSRSYNYLKPKGGMTLDSCKSLCNKYKKCKAVSFAYNLCQMIDVSLTGRWSYRMKSKRGYYIFTKQGECGDDEEKVKTYVTVKKAPEAAAKADEPAP